MNIDLNTLKGMHRLLFQIPLEPMQGQRFQPTGFPSLGAAVFQSSNGATSLLVESAQSMANRLEMTLWDETKKDLKAEFEGLSHVRVNDKDGEFLTDTVLESHRLNSPYVLEGKNKEFANQLAKELDVEDTGPIDRRKLAQTLFKYDVNSLLHGVFLAKKQLAGGRLRVARALSAFVEADRVQVAASGGVKNDHVDPKGDSATGFGNVPFARDEYTAESITMYVNMDLAQIRGYGLGDAAERLLILLGLYKLRALTSGGMRFRTACDLKLKEQAIAADMPEGWPLPASAELESALPSAIAACRGQMETSCVQYSS